MTKRNRAKHEATPLARWLKANEKTQAKFVAECLEQTGLVVRSQVVSRWVQGQALPNQHSRALIARVTRGQVPSDAWFKKIKSAAA